MELVGALTEREGFPAEDSETLADILTFSTISRAPFPLMSSQLYIPAVEESIAKETKRKQLQIRRALERIAKEIPLPSQQEDLESTRNELAAEYLCSEIDNHFDRLSPDLFKLRRVIEIKVKQGSYDPEKKVAVTIPLFADAKLDQEKWECDSAYDTSRHKYEFKISSFVPPITRDAKERVKAFRSKYTDAISRALTEPLIGDATLIYLQSAEEMDLRMFWIPKELRIETNIIDKDPFIAAQVNGRHYLVAKWDIAGELPYEHYLKEFGMPAKNPNRTMPSTQNPSQN